MVDFLGLSPFELRIQSAVRLRIACQHDHPACISIQPVNSPQGTIVPPEHVCQEGLIGIITVLRREQASRFIDHHQVIVYPENPLCGVDGPQIKIHLPAYAEAFVSTSRRVASRGSSSLVSPLCLRVTAVRF